MDISERKTLDEIAHLAVTDPSKLQPSDVTRLGDFILDHEEHLAFHRRVTGGFARPNGGALGRRLEGVANQPKAVPQMQASAVEPPPAADVGTADADLPGHQEDPAEVDHTTV